MARRLRLAVLVWLAIVGLDLLLNGALFAGLYRDGGPFFVTPIEAFRRIPIGYLAFLVLAVGIVEISFRLRSAGLTSGLHLGLGLGAALAATWSLGLFSVANIGAEVAVAFALIWFALLLTGCAVAAVGLARASLRGLTVEVAGFDLACVVVVVVLQSVGVVPTMHT